uniref:Uncharacterized protein n=2 Tax=Proboscia inermis TaxID=420281 RepID=A0A7S0C2Y5_9STRA|mmetsp:Transcript_2233/g.2309  ORF Transcript_2233/g.2309 Transcript_2233/m.2309 type:complete len:215 (+) Transcript_2233:45-689(+)
MSNSGGFSIGSSSTLATAAKGIQNAGSRVDMSLDDLISSRRKDSRRTNPKRKVNVSETSKNIVAKSIGKSKAQRQAQVNGRRKNQRNAKPKQADIDKEVKRQTVKENANKSNSMRVRNGSRRRVVLPNLAAKQTKRNAVPRTPTNKAVSAAVQAMANNGFRPPEGMQMVISFAPAPDAEKKLSFKGNDSKTKGNGSNAGVRGRRGGRAGGVRRG